MRNTGYFLLGAAAGTVLLLGVQFVRYELELLNTAVVHIQRIESFLSTVVQ